MRSNRCGSTPLGRVAFPYVFVESPDVEERVAHQVFPRAGVIATGVTTEGCREVLGADVGHSGDAVFWAAFLAGLNDRGLVGVQLVISEEHRGLQASIRRRCRGRSGSTAVSI